MEQASSLLIFELEREDSPFFRASLSLADQLLLVAPAADIDMVPPQPSRAEIHAAGLFLPSHRAMVIVRSTADTPITATARWLERRDLNVHHHVALDDRRDFSRLARFLTGSAVGLVLGGGAALGYAHVGVARALQEAGEPIDFVGGTSVGAAMGAAMALGAAPDEIIDITEEIFVKNRAMGRITIPIYSLLDHKVFDSSLRKAYRGVSIEDMPLNFFAVSANPTQDDAYIHRRGAIWEAVRASGAIPGVLPPFITREGDVLVDGAMVDNLPVSVMHDLKSGPNVVVRLRRRQPWRVSGNYETFPSRMSLWKHLIFRRRNASYPSLATVLLRGMSMTSEHRLEQRAEDPDDLIFVPRGTEGIGLLEWHKGRQVADDAYRHMSSLLDNAGGLRALIQPGTTSGTVAWR